MNSGFWEVVPTIASVIEAVAVVIALVYASREVRNAGKDRHLTLVLKINEMLDQPSARAARYHVFNEMESEPGKLSRDSYNLARDTWNMMDLLGVIADNDLASKDLLLELYSLQVVRLWSRLAPHIHYYRKERGDIASHFENLALESRVYRKLKFGEEEPSTYSSGEI